MTFAEQRQQLIKELSAIYDDSEAVRITEMVIENVTGIDRSRQMKTDQEEIPENLTQTILNFRNELLQNRPVQYVLKEAWFQGRKFYVDERVLIPRPETDELVEWVAKQIGNLPASPSLKLQRSKAGRQARKSAIGNLRILDIGTGSGCIPISLKKSFPEASVTGIDVCSEALYVAAENAITHEADIELLFIDFLNKEEWNKLGMFDIIISNPPYVPQKDKTAMHANVLNYEPHKALFVPDNDALIFYDAIADFGKKHLSDSGSIFVEIHESMGKNAEDLFSSHGYAFTETRKDMQGKDRMIRIGKEAL